MNHRGNRHFEVSSRLSLLSDEKIKKLLSKTPETIGWGRNSQIDISGHQVFIKRIPVTALEAENLYSTKNLFRLPTYYNYGVGSAGFGAFRELAAHVKTTNWVLNGDNDNFPIMHHHRLLPYNEEPISHFKNEKALKGYVAYWNNSKAVEKYTRARIAAPFELVIFLEHVEFQMGSWLSDNPAMLASMLKKLLRTVDFLHENKVIHFDSHSQNLMTDGKIPYLCDYGLVLDAEFDLNTDERRFFDRHRHYDYGQILTVIGQPIMSAYMALSGNERADLHKKLGCAFENNYYEFLTTVNENILDPNQKSLLKIGASQIAVIRRYKPVVDLIHGFFASLRKAKRKNAEFPQAALKRQLKKVGILN